MPTNREGFMREYYHKNKDKFNNPLEKKKRAKRNRARRQMRKKLGEAAIKGKEVHHKKPLRSGGGNNINNLGLKSIKANR
jgi:hypothetical protein